MMESSNLNLDLHHHHHHHHEDFHGSSSAPAPPFHFVTRNHDWNQHLLLNSGGGDDHFMPAGHGAQYSIPGPDTAMAPNLGILQWPAADRQGVKEELAGADLGSYHHVAMPPSRPAAAGELGFDPCVGFGRGSFGTVVLPTANVLAAGPDQLPAVPYSNPMGMDVQALDLLASARFRRTLCAQPTVDDMAYGLGQLQQQHASLSQNKISPPPVSGSNGNGLDYKATQSVAKKPRLESRSSFTPFKVRKEKLGDRIAALQQLVAPFGKTDTASVLMEAIGYIKFLQDQIETLSVPYMRSSNTRKMRTSEEISTEGREEPKLDLRSRGLCLVPLSCTSYFTNENEGVWSPPNYRGGT